MTSALIISAIISYLLGSLNFGIIISKSLNKDDVRSHGSGNAGSTNMLRNYGKKHAVMTIIGDMLKVAVAIFISFVIVRKMGNISLAENGGALILGIDARMFTKSFAGLFCVLGHIFPCFFGFKGGKGVATAGGMVFMIDWRIALICNYCVNHQIRFSWKHCNGSILSCFYICFLQITAADSFIADIYFNRRVGA